ncbi:STAS domain-containing protein [Paenibacillus arenilitoris]|uniref:Anti-sigma factor antagonist n=1 Tax=Paenibacillus arenilitoris TaxID=2772299 RepID=A0A927CGD4_9BACL|nr:STAS domain-containing protein [Paenibacillus arenilitoris]MBD2867598.1 STAS domain-containing protein [Paenibacillus arenilitoris]
MNIQAMERNGVTIIPLEGRLDGSNAAVAEQAFLQLLAEGKQRFVFDFSGLQYISSAGLRVILVAAKKLRATKGRMICAGLGEQVYDVFEMSGFTTILEMAATVEEAVEKMEAGA